MSFAFHVFTSIGIYSLLSFGYYLVFRTSGLLSIAYGVYFAIGAYAYALGGVAGSHSVAPPLIIGAALCIGVASLEAILAVRLRSDSFFIGSLAIQAVVYSVALNWASPDSVPGTLQNLTNGAFGLPAITRPVLFGFHTESDGAFLLLTLAIAFVGHWIFRRIVDSPFARAAEVCRDDERASTALGKSPSSIRLRACVAGSLFGYAGGILYAAQTGYVDPGVALTAQTIAVLAMVSAGAPLGLKTPVFGVLVLVSVPELLRLVRISSSVAANLQVLAYGVLLIIVAHYTPARKNRGLQGIDERS